MVLRIWTTGTNVVITTTIGGLGCRTSRIIIDDLIRRIMIVIPIVLVVITLGHIFIQILPSIKQFIIIPAVEIERTYERMSIVFVHK